MLRLESRVTCGCLLQRDGVPLSTAASEITSLSWKPRSFGRVLRQRKKPLCLWISDKVVSRNEKFPGSGSLVEASDSDCLTPLRWVFGGAPFWLEVVLGAPASAPPHPTPPHLPSLPCPSLPHLSTPLSSPPLRLTPPPTTIHPYTQLSTHPSLLPALPPPLPPSFSPPRPLPLFLLPLLLPPHLRPLVIGSHQQEEKWTRLALKWCSPALLRTPLTR